MVLLLASLTSGFSCDGTGLRFRHTIEQFVRFSAGRRDRETEKFRPASKTERASCCTMCLISVGRTGIFAGSALTFMTVVFPTTLLDQLVGPLVDFRCWLQGAH